MDIEEAMRIFQRLIDHVGTPREEDAYAVISAALGLQSGPAEEREHARA